MMNSQRILDAAGFHDEQANATFRHCLIICFGLFSDVARRLDEGRTLRGFYDSVAGFYFPDKRRFQ